MQIDNHVNNIEIMDHYQESMENNPCYLYVQNEGHNEVHHLEPVDEKDDFLEEAFESAYMNISPLRFRYPFSGLAVDIAEGDSWSTYYDSAKIYINVGSPPSLVDGNATCTLKRVKEKKGRKIAYIECKELLTMESNVIVNFLNVDRLIEGNATGTAESDVKWDIDTGYILKHNVVTNIAGDFEMDDKTFYMKVFMRQISKKIK